MIFSADIYRLKLEDMSSSNMEYKDARIEALEKHNKELIDLVDLSKQYQSNLELIRDQQGEQIHKLLKRIEQLQEELEIADSQTVFWKAQATQNIDS